MQLPWQGLLADFTRGVHGTPVSNSGIRIDLSTFNFFDHCGCQGRFYCATNWSNRGVALLVDHFGPIHDTI